MRDSRYFASPQPRHLSGKQPAHPVGSGRQTEDGKAEIELLFGVSPGSGCSPGPLQLNAGPPYRSRLYLCLYQLPRRPQSWRRLSVDGSAHWLYSARSRSITSTGLLPHRSGWSALAMPWMPCMYWGLGSPCHVARHACNLLQGPVTQRVRNMALCSGPWGFLPCAVYIVFISGPRPVLGRYLFPPFPSYFSDDQLETDFTRSSHSSTDPTTNSQSAGFPQPRFHRRRPTAASRRASPPRRLTRPSPRRPQSRSQTTLLKSVCPNRGRPSSRPSPCLSDPTTAPRQPSCPPPAGPRRSRR